MTLVRDDFGSDRFRLVSQLSGSALEVTLSGDFDMATTFRLESELDRLLAEGDVQRVVLDLRDVQFIDSSGLGALLSIRERAHTLGIAIAVREASEPVRRLLHVTGTSDLLAD